MNRFEQEILDHQREQKDHIEKSIDFSLDNAFQDEIEKSINHKYFKREGNPGNYKYYYTEEEYAKTKGAGTQQSNINGQLHESLKNELKEIIETLTDEIDDEEFGSRIKDVLHELKGGKYKEAITKYRESELHYAYGNTYDKLKRLIADINIDNKYGFDWGTKSGEYEVWRSGDVGTQENGIFFSINKEGAEAYSDGGKRETKRYKISINNPLVARRAEDAYSKLSGKTIKQILDVRDKAKDVGDWWLDLDKKVAKLAKTKGYDAITYTAPAPPASRELILLNKNSIKGEE